MSYQTEHRRPPQSFAADRQPGARQPYESLPAYRAWLVYLEEGSIRRAAHSLGKNRCTLERYSRRWRWPERKRRILSRHAQWWKDLAVYEEKHNLDAAADTEELVERENEATFAALEEELEPEAAKVYADLLRLLER